ncbi:hypothetical protein O3P69_014067 [Scylla paramamosain]|uniref:HMG box domain-containing protein n=1 Tax=Scylla paramamosain TaxID=85552 RepID=A0AAW0ST30_SCYPA
MALRRLSVAHSCLRAAGTVRSASRTTESEGTFENEKPLCPGNAFTLFLETQNYIYEAACKWNKLPQEDKRIFQLKAKELEKKYKDEVSKWEMRMQQSGHRDVVQRHHQLTDGKNLAIERSWAAEMDQDQDSMVTTEENVSHVMEEEKSDIKLIKDGTEALIKDRVEEEKNTLIKETEKEEKLHKSIETQKEEKLHKSIKEPEKEEKLHKSIKETQKEENLHIEEAVIRNLSVQSSESSTKPFRSKQKQIIITKKIKSFSW